MPVYRWEPPADIGPLDRLTDAVLAGGVDVVAFTSAPAAASLLRRAGERGVLDDLLHRLRGPVLALCVGPVTAAPLLTVTATRSRSQESRFNFADVTASRAAATANCANRSIRRAAFRSM